MNSKTKASLISNLSRTLGHLQMDIDPALNPAMLYHAEMDSCDWWEFEWMDEDEYILYRQQGGQWEYRPMADDDDMRRVFNKQIVEQLRALVTEKPASMDYYARRHGALFMLIQRHIEWMYETRNTAQSEYMTTTQWIDYLLTSVLALDTAD